MKIFNIILSFALLFLGNVAQAQTVCVKPTGVSVSSTPNNMTGTAVATWPTANYAAGTTYLVTYGIPGTTIQTTVPATTSPFTITGLSPCQAYTLTVKAVCSATSSSDSSVPTTFTSNGCSANCAAPTGVTATPFSTVLTIPNNQAATIAWNTAGYPTGTAYVVEYKLATATTWTLTTAQTSPRNIDGLLPCTAYQVRIKAVCSSTAASTYSTPITFTTLGTCPSPCAAPSIVVQTATQPAGAIGQSAVVAWATTSYPTGTYYIVEYKKSTATTWQLYTATASPATIPGLDACTEYQFRAKAFCSNSSSSTYSNQVTTTTLGCISTCNAPVVTASVNPALSSFSGTVTWNNAAYGAGTTFILEYKKSTATTWTTVTATASPYTITGLDPCSEYQVRMKAVCSNTLTSVYSVQTAFTTVGCTLPCNPPVLTTTLTGAASGTTGAAAVLVWSTVPYPTGTTFIIEYKKNTAANWTVASTSATASPYTLAGLDNCTEYFIRIKALCPNTNGSTYSNVSVVFTGNCPLPCSAPQLSVGPVTPTATPSGKVSWNTSAYAAGTTFVLEYRKNNNPNWTIVSNATSPYTITALDVCAEYLVRVKAICSATSSSTYSNQVAFLTDGCNPTPCIAPIVGAQAFQTPGATSYSATASWNTANYAAGTTYTFEYKKNTATTWTIATATSSPFTITGLDACSEYLIRVKANCSATASSPYSNVFGIQTGGCPPVCATPIILVAAASLDPTKGIVLWNTTVYPAGTTFSLEYKTSTATTWTIKTVSTSPDTLVGLTACTEYQVRIKANCTAPSAYSLVKTFKTAGCPPPPTCATPTQLVVTNITNTTAKATWSANTAVTSYTVQYKALLVPNAPWVTVNNVTTNSVTLTGLIKCRYYTVKVKANCSNGGTSSFSNARSFKTTGCPTTPIAIDNLVASPNPGTNTLNVQYNIESENNINIGVYNIQGQLVKTLMNEKQSAGFYTQSFEDMSTLNAGIYFVILRNEKGEQQVTKWIKE